MNNIILVGKDNFSEQHVFKTFSIIAPEENGEITLAYCGKTIAVQFGEVAIIPPNFKFSALANGKILYAQIDQTLLPLKEPLIFPDIAGGVYSSLKQAFEISACKAAKKELVMEALGNLIISYAILALGQGGGFSPVVNTIRADIDNNISNTYYSLDDFLKKLPLNYDYVRKLFKKQTGATPHEYLLSRRMQRASQLLSGGAANQYSKYSVAQIAEACGYSEPLYFSRVFKKYYGVSPSAYSEKNTCSPML